MKPTRKTIIIPAECLEPTEKINHFRVWKEMVEGDAKKNEMVNFFLKGSGFVYHGEIYHKTKDYLFIYLY